MRSARHTLHGVRLADLGRLDSDGKWEAQSEEFQKNVACGGNRLHRRIPTIGEEHKRGYRFAVEGKNPGVRQVSQRTPGQIPNVKLRPRRAERRSPKRPALAVIALEQGV